VGLVQDSGSEQPEDRSLASERSFGSVRHATDMLELSREECLRLLATHHFGRLAVNIGAGIPVVRPINYAFDGHSQAIVFRTALGSKFHALLRAAHAAFEIDGVDGASRTGWSVIMSGVTDEITSTSEIARLDELGLDPWAPGPKRHWMHIRAWTVSGRRIRLAHPDVPGYHLG
jgi:nitroimidazol reductase NimA-like FMN-containing flavoprotein (pyridoxamine 5'-phosphate oxidase superfamily)